MASGKVVGQDFELFVHGDRSAWKTRLAGWPP